MIKTGIIFALRRLKVITNDRFRDVLHSDFDKMDIHSKKQLGVLMRNRGYHSKYDYQEQSTVYVSPSQPQLDYAWNFLKYGIVENKGVEFRPDRDVSVEYINERSFRLRDKKTGRFAKKEV